MNALRKQHGFTLIELIIVIVLSGIVASMTVSILTLPINAYVDSARRATLTDSAESAMNRMKRDIQAALPNSIRISSDGQYLELLPIIDGGRYRRQLTDAGAGDILDFTIQDTRFDVLGSLQHFNDITLDSDLVVVYPLASSGNNAYAGDNTATIKTGSTKDTILFTNGFRFPLQSPQQRFYIIDDNAITYHCNTSAPSPKNKTLMRYQGYGILATQPEPPTTGGAIQSNNMSACQFSYNSGSSLRSGLVTITLTLADESGESIRLTQQVHVRNQP